MSKYADPKRGGTLGWEQFLSNRTTILTEFDKAREFGKIGGIEVQHGNALEEEIRKWLASFLPMRYGVAKARVISQGMSDAEVAPEFDVVIYDRLNSPTLWIDQNGLRGLPAENVLGVIEVKASLTLLHAEAANKQLLKLEPLLGVDATDELYPKYLPAQFFSFSVFGEVREDQSKNGKVLDALVFQQRGHSGSFIIRGSGVEQAASGTVSLTFGNGVQVSTIDNGESIFGSPIANSKPLGNGHLSAMLIWSPSNFSRFAFTILNLLNGSCDPGKLPSMHAMSWPGGHPSNR